MTIANTDLQLTNINNINYLKVEGESFNFLDLITGECPLLDYWVDQLNNMPKSDAIKLICVTISTNIKIVAVESKFTWVADNFIHYRSNSVGEWIIMEFDHFFKLNKDLFKAYSGSTDTKS